jgi:5'(3')-deoxyribonucleotidase
MIIYVDLDQTLNDLVSKTLTFYNALTGKNVQMSDMTAYHIDKCLSEEEVNKVYELWGKKELWDSLEPLPDAQWGIETLVNTGHRVIIATATYYEQFDWKLAWVKKHFPMIDTKDIIRINDKSLLRGDVLIEDNIDNLTKSCCERICLDYPYNCDKNKDWAYGIYRAHNWKEIIKTINNIERKMKEWEKM